MSNDEIHHIEQFVSNGGVVIADSATGLMDEHCAWQQSEIINQLFGISPGISDKRELKLIEDDVQLKNQAQTWGMPSIALTGIRIAEPELTASGGTTLVQVGKGEAAIVNSVGKGWTIYLNTTWDQYPKQRANNFGGVAYRELARAILEKAGVHPSIQVLTPDGHPISQAQIARYKFENSEILAIVKDNVGLKGVVGRDGVTTYNDAKLGQVGKQELTIKLPEKMFVADVRSGKQFGYTDVVRTSILIGDALVLGLSKTENLIKLNGANSAQPGNHIRFELVSGTNATRLVRCHVFGPEGSLLPTYSGNVLLRSGSGSFVLPFALNDAPGKYVIKATDVVSGATIEKTIELR